MNAYQIVNKNIQGQTGQDYKRGIASDLELE